MLFFEFPDDARWNDDHAALEFSGFLGPYEASSGSAGAAFSFSSISRQPPNAAWRRSICSERGSNSWPQLDRTLFPGRSGHARGGSPPVLLLPAPIRRSVSHRMGRSNER